MKPKESLTLENLLVPLLKLAELLVEMVIKPLHHWGVGQLMTHFHHQYQVYLSFSLPLQCTYCDLGALLEVLNFYTYYYSYPFGNSSYSSK